MAQPSEQRCRRWELSREEALKLWAEKRLQGWQACEPQWALAPKRQQRDEPLGTSMGRYANPQCF